MAAADVWSVESGDSRRLFAADTGLAVFAESRGAYARPHSHPAWKIVVGLDGIVDLARPSRPTLYAPGIAVPPEHHHAGGSPGPYVALYVDPWRVRADPSRGPIALDAGTVRRIVAACSVESVEVDVPDLAEGRVALDAALGSAPGIDPRIAYVLDRLSVVDRLDVLGDEVGLSPSRLRALVRSTVGIPLGRLRQWARLRAAVGQGLAVADAAHVSGFADQSHLTRTAGRLVGRTPGSLAPGSPLSAPQPPFSRQ